MEEKELKKFEKRLILLKDEIMKVIEGNEENDGSRESMDEIDQAQELIELEMGSLMSSSHRANLTKVEDALDRIQNNRYGICERCGQEIAMKRLKALPFARYCISCQQKIEDNY